ncbi:MAG: zf-HC2 domain-containing protein [Candidatus Omnitrophica bacterium]|nr:zf-HC2 domain-containing protein [Candidatus Omnitrophota bacterium]
MNCHKVKKLLPRYVDNELADAETLNRLATHLKTCLSCSRELNSIMVLKKLVSGQERLQAPDDFLARVKDRLKPEPQIIRLEWVPEAGILAKWLIPVPVTAFLVLAVVLFGSIKREMAAEQKSYFDPFNTEMILSPSML